MHDASAARCLSYGLPTQPIHRQYAAGPASAYTHPALPCARRARVALAVARQYRARGWNSCGGLAVPHPDLDRDLDSTSRPPA